MPTPKSADVLNKHRDAPADPQILNVPDPDEPWARVWPGERIEEGDIFYDASLGEEAHWRLCSSAWAGQAVPGSGYAIARLCPPDGYRRLEGSDVVRGRDLCWSGEKWVLVRDTVLGDFIDRPFDYVVERWEAEHNTRPMVCTMKNPTAQRVVEVPAHHRKLWGTEAIRRGDKYLVGASEMDDWEDVPESMLGLIVEDPAESNDFVRYCRPISPTAQVWYVDPLTGTETGLGGRVDPFKSLEQAKAAISGAAEKAGTPAFGIILNVNGQPLLVYDLPEPEAEEPPAPAPEAGGIPDREDSPAEAVVEADEGLPQPVGNPDRENPGELDGGIVDMIREDSNSGAGVLGSLGDQLFEEIKAEEDAKVEELMNESVDEVLEMSKELLNDGEPPAGTIDEIAAHLEISVKVVRDRANGLRPQQYTDMPTQGVIQPTDLWYGPMAEDFDVLMWQPVPDKLVDMPISYYEEYLLARKRKVVTRIPPVLREGITRHLEEIHTAMDHIKDLLDIPE